jgi:hypothetical protein
MEWDMVGLVLTGRPAAFNRDETDCRPSLPSRDTRLPNKMEDETNLKSLFKADQLNGLCHFLKRNQFSAVRTVLSHPPKRIQ